MHEMLKMLIKLYQPFMKRPGTSVMWDTKQDQAVRKKSRGRYYKKNNVCALHEAASTIHQEAQISPAIDRKQGQTIHRTSAKQRKWKKRETQEDRLSEKI